MTQKIRIINLMNLSFLSKSDKEYFQKLFVISGCSDLLDSKEASKLLGNFSREDFFEGCKNLNKQDFTATTKSRSEEELSECLHQAARHSNAEVISYFLDNRPSLFNAPNKETGNLPLHTYLR